MVHNFPNLIFSRLAATNMRLQTFSSMEEKKILEYKFTERPNFVSIYFEQISKKLFYVNILLEVCKK